MKRLKRRAVISRPYPDVRGPQRPDSDGHPCPPRGPGGPDRAGDRRTFHNEPAGGVAASEGAGARGTDCARARRPEAAVLFARRAPGRGDALAESHTRSLGGAIRPPRTLSDRKSVV